MHAAITRAWASASPCTCRLALGRGFTLIEMLTVVSVIAVVAAIAAPGMRSFVAGQRLKALSYDMTADLLLARSEALKRNTPVSMTAASGTDWASGWALAASGVNISTRNVANESVTFSAAPSTTIPSTITFDVNGRSSTTVRMTIESSAAPGNNAKRCIQLDLSGRARSAVGVCT